MINGHGDDIQTELIANFSSNVWYNANNSALYEHLRLFLPSISHYPEVASASLKHILAQKYILKENQFVVCNGSTEAFYLIAHTFSGKKSLIVTPTFSEYSDACRIHNHTVYLTKRFFLLSEIERINPNLVWICNPNNPDGFFYTRAELKRLLTDYPHTIFVIDQAYIEFIKTDQCLLSDITSFDNLIVVQSMTKRYAIPGLRLGYIVSSPTIADDIATRTMPWSVNTLAIEAGKYIFELKDNFNIDEWLNESIQFQQQIGYINGFEVTKSETPFFLIKLKFGKASELKQYLLNEKILIRDASNFEGLNGEYIRVCTLFPKINDLLLQKLKIWSQFI